MGDDESPAVWLPLIEGLTPHGLRHSHKTWMLEDAVPEVLQAERLGHTVPGIRGVYSHVSESMRDDLKAKLQRRWEESLAARLDFGGRSAVELGGGMYNNTYRLTLAGQPQPVVLRVAPAPERQFSSERTLMRNEYASVPYLAALAPLMPQVIAADWSREVVGRDYMLQTFLEGVPAPERLGDYPRSSWPGFFAQMGSIARTVHHVRGPWFGPVIGPAHATWSGALTASLDAIAGDLDGVGLDATDVRAAAVLADEHRAVLDEIREPRLLTGDLWTVNVMLDAVASEPTITGVLDMDRTWWGDPAADWTIRMALAKNDERTAFWDSYERRETSVSAAWRARLYEARHLGSVRLERHRLGNAEGVRESYPAFAAVLADLNQ